jgi:hypothetical protein
VSTGLPNTPFRVMRPTLGLLTVSVQTALTAVYTPEWPHQKLAAKIMMATQLTKAIKNPTRPQMLAVLTGWYSYALELNQAVESTHPQIAAILQQTLKEVEWVKPLYEHVEKVVKST